MHDWMNIIRYPFLVRVLSHSRCMKNRSFSSRSRTKPTRVSAILAGFRNIVQIKELNSGVEILDTQGADRSDPILRGAAKADFGGEEFLLGTMWHPGGPREIVRIPAKLSGLLQCPYMCSASIPPTLFDAWMEEEDPRKGPKTTWDRIPLFSLAFSLRT